MLFANSRVGRPPVLQGWSPFVNAARLRWTDCCWWQGVTFKTTLVAIQSPLGLTDCFLPILGLVARQFSRDGRPLCLLTASLVRVHRDEGIVRSHFAIQSPSGLTDCVFRVRIYSPRPLSQRFDASRGLCTPIKGFKIQLVICEVALKAETGFIGMFDTVFATTQPRNPAISCQLPRCLVGSAMQSA